MSQRDTVRSDYIIHALDSQTAMISFIHSIFHFLVNWSDTRLQQSLLSWIRSHNSPSSDPHRPQFTPARPLTKATAMIHASDSCQLGPSRLCHYDLGVFKLSFIIISSEKFGASLFRLDQSSCVWIIIPSFGGPCHVTTKPFSHKNRLANWKTLAIPPEIIATIFLSAADLYIISSPTNWITYHP